VQRVCLSAPEWHRFVLPYPRIAPQLSYTLRTQHPTAAEPIDVSADKTRILDPPMASSRCASPFETPKPFPLERTLRHLGNQGCGTAVDGPGPRGRAEAAPRRAARSQVDRRYTPLSCVVRVHSGEAARDRPSLAIVRRWRETACCGARPAAAWRAKYASNLEDVYRLPARVRMS
jgi:hypothetical protein